MHKYHIYILLRFPPFLNNLLIETFLRRLQKVSFIFEPSKTNKPFDIYLSVLNDWNSVLCRKEEERYPLQQLIGIEGNWYVLAMTKFFREGQSKVWEHKCQKTAMFYSIVKFEPYLTVRMKGMKGGNHLTGRTLMLWRGSRALFALFALSMARLQKFRKSTQLPTHPDTRCSVVWYAYSSNRLSYS
jgi:hypothetical protein